MKRFIVFTGLTYYPSGGWKDFEKSFDTLIGALEYVAKCEGFDWYQIVDIEEGRVVSSTDLGA